MVRKMILTMVVVSLSMVFTAQNLFAQLDPLSQQYNDMLTKWIEYNNWDKAKAYAAIDNIYEQVGATFPKDPALQKQYDDYIAAGQEKLNVKAQQMGFASLEAALYQYKYSTDPRVIELSNDKIDLFNEANKIFESWNKEYTRRFYTASIETINRLLENANTMK